MEVESSESSVFGVLTDVEWNGFSVHMRIINELVLIW